MNRLVTQVLRASLGVLVVVLLASGVATGTLLHLEQVRARDAALLAAAQAWGKHDWQAEHTVSPVSVHLAHPGDPLLPPGWGGASERDEHVRWTTVGDQRVLLLPVEKGDEENEEHALLIASADRVTVAASVGPFATAYTLVAVLAAGGGALLQRRLLLRATAPLLSARDAVGEVVGAVQGARVPVEGPEEVADLLRAVNALLTRLDDAFRTQARFTAEAAHELRTPVTAMLGELDVTLRRPRTAEEYAATLVSVREEVGRLGALVEGLLLLARVDAGQVAQDRASVSVTTMVTQAMLRERATIEQTGGSLRVGTLPTAAIAGQPALLVSALSNLLRNAAVHAPGTAVSVKATVSGKRVLIVVTDGGPGVPAADREAVFDRLARGGQARRDSAGLGLGLPLAREIARRHGGDCRITDGDGGGCTAVLELPVA